MNNEDKALINTEDPIEVSDELLKELMKASERIKRGKFISHEEMKAYVQQLIDDYDSLPLYQENIVKKDKKQQAGTVRDL